jgi:hypothetical protein
MVMWVVVMAGVPSNPERRSSMGALYGSCASPSLELRARKDKNSSAQADDNDSAAGRHQEDIAVKAQTIILRVMQAALCLPLLAGCASGPDIRTDYDRSVDFSGYRSYGFFQPMSIESPNYSTIFGSVFREAISREMEARGYVRSDNPDLLINVSASRQEKLQVTQTASPGPYGYYGYRGGMYGAWGGYGWDTQTHVNQYTEGTVNVDMVDRAQKRMVWEGVAIGRVKEGLSNEEVRERVRSGVAEMFQGYPFRAAQ